MSTIEVSVIGAVGTLRNPNLPSVLRGLNVRFIKPVDGELESSESNFGDPLVSKRLFGRDLSPSERGCALAHENARKGVRSDWVLVLEDDADISREQALTLIRHAQTLDPVIPTIVSAYEAVPSKVQRVRLKQINHLPGGAVAYMASRAACSVPVNRENRFGPSDWPLYTVGFRFMVLQGLGVKEIASAKSTIADPGLRDVNPVMYYIFRFFYLPANIGRFGLAGLKYSIISPLLRDFSNRLKAMAQDAKEPSVTI